MPELEVAVTTAGRRRIGPRALPPARAALAAAAAFGVACSTVQTPPPADATPAGVVDRDRADAMVRRDRERIERLNQIAATGVVEFRWRDDAGEEHHEPQVNAKLWIQHPRRTALRAEKLGEVLFWFGSDDERSWFFDLLDEPTVLYVSGHDDPMRFEGAPGLPFAPLALFDLLGLTPLGRVGGGAAAAILDVYEDPHADAIVVHAIGAGGPMRVYFGRSDGLPVRVESLSETGEVAVFSTLRRYRPVEPDGVARPRLATLIDIADPSGAASVKLALGAVTTDVDPARLATVFDLGRLEKAMRTQLRRGAAGVR